MSNRPVAAGHAGVPGRPPAGKRGPMHFLSRPCLQPPAVAGAAALVLLLALTPATSVGSARAQDADRSGAPVRLVVPALGVDATVIALPLNDDLSMPAPPGAQPAAWYTYSAPAGAPGNAVLAGHRDFGGRRGIFFGLDSLVEGDEVWLQDGAGAWYLYRVTWAASLPEEAAPLPEVVGWTERASLTLITCSGTFSPSAGQYLERRVVRAELVATVPPDGARGEVDGSAPVPVY